uniref:uncharacterized protein LOC122597008 n=1 Tax=Erigeron canadensis TaxID=72917 RepID=UPI001CB8D9A8|nr:uncharacterized protein LOC122597008 [Erigeron canadensis]
MDTTNLFPNKLSSNDAVSMIRAITDNEVKDALFSMGDDKSPRPDGFSAAFFKAALDVIGTDVMAAVKDFFHSGKLLKELNHTIIALIPKVAAPARVTDFRPISLCNVLFKCITKIIVNRMKESLKSLISENQSAFVPGRRISDNILLVQELMHNYHLDLGPPRCAFKVDIQKAYDTVDWGFLKTILIEFGFNERMVAWIMECVSSTTFSISINGMVHGYFHGKRGLHQGDPLSPYLFTLVMEVLTLMLKRQVTLSGTFRYHKHCSDVAIINLCFADDLFIFLHGDSDSARVIMNGLNEFKNVSGLQPSLPKIFALPSRVIHEIEQMMRNFLWSQGSVKRGASKVAWEDVCLPKEEGGLGIRRLATFNTALLSAHIWSIISLKESLWVRWIHTYELRGKSFWEVPLKGCVTWGWRKLLQARNQVRPFFYTQIGDGLSTSAWYDNWCYGPLISHISPRIINNVGFHLNTKVAEVIDNEVWAWPTSWNTFFPNLVPFPLVNGVTDRVFWKNRYGLLLQFSVSVAWEDLRQRSNEVSWHRLVWFPQYILKHSFILWLVMRRRLKTQDLLQQWDVSTSNASPLCSLCGHVADSHDHLFFECDFSSKVWDSLKIKAELQGTSHEWKSIITNMSGRASSNSIANVVSKLLLAATTYYVWQERNQRLFGSNRRTTHQLVDAIVHTVRLKLMTCRFKKTRRVERFLSAWDLPVSLLCCMDCLEEIFLNPNAPEGVNDEFVYEEPDDEFESPDVRAEFDYDHDVFYTKEVFDTHIDLVD